MHLTQSRRGIAIAEAMARLTPMFRRPFRSGAPGVHPELRALSRYQLRDVGLETAVAGPICEVDARVMTALMAMR